jgi:hypothetical protein
MAKIGKHRRSVVIPERPEPDWTTLPEASPAAQPVQEPAHEPARTA